MSIFDPDSFMNSEVEGANDTVVVPVPPGTYNAQIEEVKFRTVGEAQDKHLIDVTYNLLDDEVKAALGRDKVTIRQSIWLDISNGALDMSKGKNVGLGKLRAALDLNDPSKPFKLSMLHGGLCKIVTGLRADKTDPTIQYGEVKSVGRA